MTHAHPDNWVDLLHARAETAGDTVAFRFLRDGETDEQTLTYRQLFARARAIATALREVAKEGDRALLLCPPGLEFVVGFMGCMFAGAIAVPAPPPRRGNNDRAAQRLVGIVADCTPRVALATHGVAPAVIESLTAIDPNLNVLAIDDVAVGDERNWNAPRRTRDTLACLQYTSGSTRAPRGVKLTHGNLLDNSETIRQAFNHTTDSSGVIWLPPYHDMGLIGGILQPLFAGFPVTLMSPQAFLVNPIRWLRAVSRYRATTSGGPDFAYDLCASSIDPTACQDIDLSSWRVAFTGAEPVRARTLDCFAAKFAPFGFRREALYPCYGLAEATLIVSGVDFGAGPKVCDIDRAALSRGQATCAPGGKPVVCCGTMRGGIEARIVNPQTLYRCPDGTIGEIWLRGGSVVTGYWQGDDQAFQARLATGEPDTYFRSGDLGFTLDGELYITGRLKDLIIIRGVNHYPQDIEQTIENAHPALRPGFCAAFAIERDGQEQLAVACEIERTHRHRDLQPIIDAMREAIARIHEIEVAAVALLMPGQLPKTCSGKIQRIACRQQWLAGQLQTLVKWEAEAQESAPAAPLCNPLLSGQIKPWLVSRLAERLSVPPDQIDCSQPLARYGLGSAAAVGLAGEISEAINRDLPATLFWDYPSIDLLAEYLESAGT